MGIDREGFLPEPAVEHDIGSLAPYPRQADQLLAGGGDLAAEFVDQQLRQRDHVPGLGIEQADRLDVFLEALLAQIEHLLRGLHLCEQRAGRLVHADIGRLGRERDRDHQLKGVAEFQFGFGGRIVFGQAAEEFEDLMLRHGPFGASGLGCAAFHSIARSTRFSTEGWV